MTKKIFSLVFPLIVFFFLACFMFIFSYSTSPLYPNSYGNDSAFFRFMGLSVRSGKTLYKDVWDNKGPVLFFIQALGTLGGTKNGNISGIFILQIISICLSVFLMWQADLVLNPVKQEKLHFVMIILYTCSLLGILLEGGNYCEEWCLPLISCSLLLITVYAAGAAEHPAHSLKYAFVHGICLGLIAFIRINNAISICTGMVGIGIFLIYKKLWKNLLLNILFGFLGITVAAVPIVIYFWKMQALPDMLNAVFFHNLKYIGQNTNSKFSGIDLMIRYLPLTVSILQVLIHIIRKRRFTLMDGLLISMLAVNCIMFLHNNIYLHYFIITVPLIMLVMSDSVNHSYRIELLLGISVFILFIYQSIENIPMLDKLHHAEPRYQSAAYIPKNEKSSAIAIWTPPDIYLSTGIQPCSRYCAYQKIHFSVDPAMKQEFIIDLQNAQPKWILEPCNESGMYNEIKNMLNDRYTLQFSELGICFFRSDNDL